MPPCRCHGPFTSGVGARANIGWTGWGNQREGEGWKTATADMAPGDRKEMSKRGEGRGKARRQTQSQGPTEQRHRRMANASLCVYKRKGDVHIHNTKEGSG